MEATGGSIRVTIRSLGQEAICRLSQTLQFAISRRRRQVGTSRPLILGAVNPRNSITHEAFGSENINSVPTPSVLTTLIYFSPMGLYGFFDDGQSQPGSLLSLPRERSGL